MATEQRLIDANELLKDAEDYTPISDGLCDFYDVKWLVASQPTIDPESLRPKGKWRKYSSDEWICTNCGYDKYCDTLDGGVLPGFCEGCGAKMEGKL